MKGKVYLVGAGCGTIDLLTLRAKEILEISDCIIYDRLLDNSILKFAKQDAHLIYFGKENTEGGIIQESINRAIVENALNGKTVARLKGGDPFVFGRASEELDAILEQKIDFEIVPGISSAIAAAEYAGIAVTHRNIATSFHVFTGHTAKGSEWHNFSIISKLEGTLIFLMGIGNLDKIVNGLLSHNKPKNTQIAIIENACTNKQKTTVSSLDNILNIASKNKIEPPAVIVIGDVVRLQDKFAWFEKKKILNKNILITGDKNNSQNIISKLKKLDANIFELPFIEIEHVNKDINLEKLKRYKAILFNSKNGVKTFLNKIEDLRILGNIKIGVVGSETKKEFLKNKIVVDFFPNKYTVMDLAAESEKHTNINDDILIVTSNISPIDLSYLNKRHKRNFEKLVLYNTNPISQDKNLILETLDKIEYIIFLSSSVVDSFWASIDGDIKIVENKKIVSIGSVTTRTIEKYNMKVSIEASIFNVDGVIDAISKHINTQGDKNV